MTIFDKKKTFEELLESLFQYRYILSTLIQSILLIIIYAVILFLTAMMPNGITFGDTGLVSFFTFTFIVLFIPLLSIKLSSRNSDRRIYLINSIIEAILENLSEMNLFENDDEKRVLENNLRSLYMFETVQDYKYCHVVMGSIIEFLLIKYCNLNNINPEDYTSPHGDVIPGNRRRFCNYIQAAIKNDIFGLKSSWYLVQNNLRNFRNYVHISKEIREEKIDDKWYNSTHDVFFRIIYKFKPKKVKNSLD